MPELDFEMVEVYISLYCISTPSLALLSLYCISTPSLALEINTIRLKVFNLSRYITVQFTRNILYTSILVTVLPQHISLSLGLIVWLSLLHERFPLQLQQKLYLNHYNIRQIDKKRMGISFNNWNDKNVFGRLPTTRWQRYEKIKKSLGLTIGEKKNYFDNRSKTNNIKQPTSPPRMSSLF